MIAARMFWRKEKEDKIDWFTVKCFKIDGRFKPGEDANDTIKFLKFHMRNGDAATKRGGAKTFTLQEGLKYCALGKTGLLSGYICQFLEALLLRRCLERWNYAVR